MNFITHSHRNAETLFANDARYIRLYQEVIDAIYSITEADLIEEYNGSNRQDKKSLSESINHLLKQRLTALSWNAESLIFEDPRYQGPVKKTKNWRLDFAKGEISIEVAFNHGEAIAWNLLKPVMASELNHVQKAIQTSAGIIICATKAMKKAGNFDGAVGEYEKFLRYLEPMYNVLTSPLLIIGLNAPETFHIDVDSKQIVLDHDPTIDEDQVE